MMVRYRSHWPGPCWTGVAYLLELLLQAEPLSLVQPQRLWLRVGPQRVCLLAQLLLPPQKRQLLLHRFERGDGPIGQLVGGWRAETRASGQSVGRLGPCVCWFTYLLSSSSTGNLISAL